MAWGQVFKFASTDSVIESVKDDEPNYAHVGEVDVDRYDEAQLHRARKVTWVGSPGYLVKIPAANVLFMEGNQWNFGHAAALYEGIGDGERTVLEVPAARVYRVSAKDVKLTEKYERAGELEYQMAMTEPWKRSEIGTYWAQLLDGNHRAAAALAAGEPFIYVHVGENYRGNVYKKDYE